VATWMLKSLTKAVRAGSVPLLTVVGWMPVRGARRRRGRRGRGRKRRCGDGTGRRTRGSSGAPRERSRDGTPAEARAAHPLAVAGNPRPRGDVLRTDVAIARGPLDREGGCSIVAPMTTSEAPHSPPAGLIEAASRWLQPVREALGADFTAAYVTGSALRHDFSPERSRVNVLVVAERLELATLDRLAGALPAGRKGPHVDPMFMTRAQVLGSLDVFPIEWLDLVERHVLLAGADVLVGIDVPRANLRLQLEHELRGKHLRLRHEYLASARHPQRLAEVLARLASGFHALFRTLLRLRGETPPAGAEAVIERLAAVYQLDARALLGAHHVRYSTAKPDTADIRARYGAFMTEIERLVGVIDGLRVP